MKRAHNELFCTKDKPIGFEFTFLTNDDVIPPVLLHTEFPFCFLELWTL